MFYALLITSLLVSLAIVYLVARAFEAPIRDILEHIVGKELAGAWTRYMKFAMYVVGVSGGVHIGEFYQYLPDGQRYPIEPMPIEPYRPVLNAERWALTLVSTAIDTLQALAWLLLFFFLFAMIAYVIIRIWGGRRGQSDRGPSNAPTDTHTDA